ncbi:MAG: hypothetical protein V1664_05170 [Candidatus Uhrbacteria bacterium]
MAPGFPGESGIIRPLSRTEAKSVKQELKEIQKSRPFFYLTFYRDSGTKDSGYFMSPEYHYPFEMDSDRTPRKERSNEARAELSAENEAAIEEVIKRPEIKGRARFERAECQLIVDNDSSNFPSAEARKEFQASLLKAFEEKGIAAFYVQSLGDDSLIWAVVDKAVFDAARDNPQIKAW